MLFVGTLYLEPASSAIISIFPVSSLAFITVFSDDINLYSFPARLGKVLKTYPLGIINSFFLSIFWTVK